MCSLLKTITTCSGTYSFLHLQVDGIEINDYENEGYGLRCTRELREGDTVLKIPKNLLMSEETAKNSYLGSLLCFSLYNLSNGIYNINKVEFIDSMGDWSERLFGCKRGKG